MHVPGTYIEFRTLFPFVSKENPNWVSSNVWFFRRVSSPTGKYQSSTIPQESMTEGLLRKYFLIEIKKWHPEMYIPDSIMQLQPKGYISWPDKPSGSYAMGGA